MVEVSKDGLNTVKVFAQAWWASKMPGSVCKLVNIKGDGRVDVHWQDADETGKYTLPVDFMTDADNRLATLQAERDRRWKGALQDIAEAEAIPNDAVAFVWCRDIARTALSDTPTVQS